MTHKKIWLDAGKYLLGFGILALVVWRYWAPPADGNGPGLGQLLQRPINGLAVALVATFSISSLFLSFVRWYLLVRAQGLPFTLVNATRLGLVGYFFNICLPGSIGGDIIKAVGIAREQERRALAVATVLLDRGLGLWALVWLVALLGSGFWLAGNAELTTQPALQTIVRSAVGLLAVSVLVWTALSVLPEARGQRFAQRLRGLPKVGGTFAELWNAVWAYRRKQGIIALTLALSLLIHVGNVLTFYFAVQSFQAAATDRFPTLLEHFLIVPIAMVVQALFPTPGGVGAGEYSFGGLYEMLGYAGQLGTAGSLSQRFMSWVLGLVGYLVYLRMKPTLPATVAPPTVVEGPTVVRPLVRETVPVIER